MSFAVVRKFWLSWVFVALLTALCATLAVVQYGWIEQISNAQRNRLEADFQTNIHRLGKEFDETVAASFQQLQPSPAEIAEWGTHAACVRQYRRWSAVSEPIFRRVALICPSPFDSTPPEPQLYLFDLKSGDFLSSPWPATWSAQRRRYTAWLSGAALPPLLPSETTLLDVPLPDSTWIVAELSLEDLRSTLLPSLLEKYLVTPGGSTYDLEIQVPGAPPPRQPPAASVDLLRFGHPPYWRLIVYPRGFALQDQVTVARGRNLALSGGILLLILAIVVLLLDSARRSQEWANLHMNFVAGASHELRTPLAVIRTAAYNLRGPLASRPGQVEKYAGLIQKETETLGIVVEQVLRYGAATAGRAIGERHTISARRLILSTLAHSTASASSQLTVEHSIDPGLPMILADELALQHALQNLLDNAVKFGAEGGQWVGVSATAVETSSHHFLEIRVSDRGPGIPIHEQPHIFDAFFRGRRAVQDQINGTGLGLNLVKRIVEAHGGTIQVISQPGNGAEFVVRLPAALDDFWDGELD